MTYKFIKERQYWQAVDEFKETGKFIDINNTVFDYLNELGKFNHLNIMNWTDLRRQAQSKWIDDLHYQLKSFKVADLPQVRITLERIEQNRLTPYDNEKLWVKAKQIALTDYFKTL